MNFTEFPRFLKIVNTHMHTMVHEAIRSSIASPEQRHLEGWQVEAWANVNGHGHLNLPHTHTRNGNLWSAIFYVSEGDVLDETMGGRTFFQDRSGVPKEVIQDPSPFSREVALLPEPGRMVLFPGTAYHYVEVYHGHKPRITIAFNMAHPGFAIPSYEPTDFWWTNFRGVMRGRQIARAKLAKRFDSRSSK